MLKRTFKSPKPAPNVACCNEAVACDIVYSDTAAVNDGSSAADLFVGMDRTGAPPDTWLLCLHYVCFLLNHTYNISIQNVPFNQRTGNTVDISVLLRFHFWEKVYYKAVHKRKFPFESSEEAGHIVGNSKHCGHALIWKDPKEFISILEVTYKFITKGSGLLSFHLGMNFHRDDNGTLCISPRMYVEKMVGNNEKMFGETPRQTVTSPLEK